MDLLKVKDRVKELLEKYPTCRDNYEETLAIIWWQDAGKRDMSFKKFLGQFKDDQFTKFASVERVWRKWQEECPHLRGEKYNERHAEQPNVIDQLHQMADEIRG